MGADSREVAVGDGELLAVFEADGVGFGRDAIGDGGLCDGSRGNPGLRYEGDHILDGIIQNGKDFGNHGDIDMREPALTDGIIVEAREGEPELDMFPPKDRESFILLEPQKVGVEARKDLLERIVSAIVERGAAV